MKIRITVLALMLLLCLPLWGCGGETEQGDITVTDAIGREVAIAEGADSFVCIGPGCLRLYCYVGDVAELVGVEDIDKDSIGRPYLMANPSLSDLTVIGAGGPNNAADAEKLLVAEPDVIFTTYNTDASAVDELQQKTGIPVVALSYGDTAVFDPNVATSIDLIGEVTGNVERAQEVNAYFDELEADLLSRTESIAADERPTVYLGCQSMRGVHGIESTSGNFSLFNAIGARNVVDEAGITEYVMLDKEQILEMDPEVIFVDAGGYAILLDDYDTNPAYYEELQAVQNNKVFLQLPYNYYSTNIEVALADAYYMGTVLYPEQFSDIDPIVKFNEITQELLGADVYDEFVADYFGGFQAIDLDA